MIPEKNKKSSLGIFSTARQAVEANHGGVPLPPPAPVSDTTAPLVVVSPLLPPPLSPPPPPVLVATHTAHKHKCQGQYQQHTFNTWLLLVFLQSNVSLLLLSPCPPPPPQPPPPISLMTFDVLLLGLELHTPRKILLCSHTSVPPTPTPPQRLNLSWEILVSLPLGRPGKGGRA